MTSIHVFSNNQHGKDYIVGDIHGNVAILKQVLDTLPLGAEDRLFIVGDLFDRGSDPSAVFKLLETHKNIFSVRGNHEDMLLKACNPKATDHDIYEFLINGGLWVLEDEDEREWLNNWIERLKEDLKKSNQPPSKDEISDIAFLFKDACKLSDLPRILQYVESLPYIIRVAPNDPYGFIVCHSDLPFSDIDLSTKQTLTAKEIAHLTWARKIEGSLRQPHDIPFAQGKRNQHSTLVYCGHTIVTVDQHCIRTSTKHINLDVGAYCNDCIIVANHTDGSARLIHHSTTRSDAIEKYQRIANRIALYLHEMITISKYTGYIEEALAGLQSKLETMRLIMTNNLEKTSSRNQILVNDLFGLISLLPQWLLDSAFYSHAIKETARYKILVNGALTQRQGCCLFTRVEEPSPFMVHLSDIHQALVEITGHLNKMQPPFSEIFFDENYLGYVY